MNKLELTPAESYLLLNIENKDGKTLMKYSLINLLYKNVLSSEVREETEGTVFMHPMGDAVKISTNRFRYLF